VGSEPLHDTIMRRIRMIAGFGYTAYSVIRCPPFPRVANQLTSRGWEGACMALVDPALWRQEGSARDTNAISDEVLPNGTEKGGVVGIYKPRVSNMQAAV